MNNQNKILITWIATIFLLITSTSIHAGKTCEEGTTITTNFCDGFPEAKEAGSCVDGTTYICNANNEYIAGDFKINIAPFIFGCSYFNSSNNTGNPSNFIFDLDECVALTATSPVRSEAELIDNKCDADKLFNWAETKYPELFSPPEQTSQIFEEFYYRYYEDTDNYVGLSVNDMNIYVLGEVFGGQERIDTMEILITEANLISCALEALGAYQLDPSGPILIPAATPEPDPTLEPEPAPSTSTCNHILDCGHVIPYGGETDCVADGSLMWEVKTIGNGIVSHPVGSTYSMYFPELAGAEQGVSDGGHCGLQYNCDSSKFISHMNEAKYCGYDDWRLPSYSDFQSLIDNDNAAARKVFEPYDYNAGYIAVSDCEGMTCSSLMATFHYGTHNLNDAINGVKSWEFNTQLGDATAPREIILVRDIK